jgi:hypothetical protein
VDARWMHDDVFVDWHDTRLVWKGDRRIRMNDLTIDFED